MIQPVQASPLPTTSTRKEEEIGAKISKKSRAYVWVTSAGEDSSSSNLQDLPEDDMLAIQMGRLSSGDEKLAPICSRSGICHRKEVLALML